jgi:hypothetical protein
LFLLSLSLFIFLPPPPSRDRFLHAYYVFSTALAPCQATVYFISFLCVYPHFPLSRFPLSQAVLHPAFSSLCLISGSQFTASAFLLELQSLRPYRFSYFLCESLFLLFLLFFLRPLANFPLLNPKP